MARPLAPHGTEAAWRRHRRAHEAACAPCMEAHVTYRRQRRDGDRDDVLEAVVSHLTAPGKIDSPDAYEDALDNYETVKAAMARVAAVDPGKVASLSKRRSELLAEIYAYRHATEKPAADPLEALLDGGATVTSIS